jgi:hypothetical protein
MLPLDYNRTNIGWGSAEAAAATTNSNERIVVIENTLQGDDPRSRDADAGLRIGRAAAVRGGGAECR